MLCHSFLQLTGISVFWRPSSAACYIRDKGFGTEFLSRRSRIMESFRSSSRDRDQKFTDRPGGVVHEYVLAARPVRNSRKRPAAIPATTCDIADPPRGV